VSRPWHSRVHLRIEPDAVHGSLVRGWLRPRVLASSRHTVADSVGVAKDPASREELAKAVDAALLELSAVVPLSGSRLIVEVADALVHLDVAQGDLAGEGDRQLQAIAQACMGELLGDTASDHALRWQLQPDGRHLLIGAVAHAHLNLLDEVAERHQLRLHSVQPEFCLQWNRHAKSMKPGTVLFAVARGREAVIAQALNGSIAAISSGAWLDRDALPAVSAAADTPAAAGRASRAQPVGRVLDHRVDRLLASLGMVATDVAAYLLVAPATPVSPASARWTVLDAEDSLP
jgi:hypothetical protein